MYIYKYYLSTLKHVSFGKGILVFLAGKKVTVLVAVAQSCPSFCNPMDCRPPGSSVNGILQARTMEWVAIPFSKGSSQPRDQTLDLCITGRSLKRLSQTCLWVSRSLWLRSGLTEACRRVKGTKYNSPGDYISPGVLAYVNRELPHVQASFRKGRGTRD